jgi:transposase
MDQQCHYVGLDVSLETTSICVIDDAGAIIWRGKCRSDPDTISAIVRQHAPGAVRVGLETGQLSNWLTLSLRRRGVPVVCMDARHAKAALSLQINKTDANDAFGLAQVVRTGWYREVAVKSMDAHTLRMLLVARSRLVSQRQATANTIRGLLKTFGLVIARGTTGHISKCGDSLLRGYLYEAAAVLLCRDARASIRKSWPEELGPGAGETNWHATRQSRGRAQARGHHAPDLERSRRIPLDGDTADRRLRTMPGQQLTEIRRT